MAFKQLAERRRQILDGETGLTVKQREEYAHRLRVAGYDIGDRRASVPPKKQDSRVGARVKGKLAWIPGLPCQRCSKTGAVMDQMGPGWCRKNVDHLANEMVANFRARGFHARAIVWSLGEENLLPQLRRIILESCDEEEMAKSGPIPVELDFPPGREQPDVPLQLEQREPAQVSTQSDPTIPEP